MYGIGKFNGWWCQEIFKGSVTLTLFLLMSHQCFLLYNEMGTIVEKGPLGFSFGIKVLESF